MRSLCVATVLLGLCTAHTGNAATILVSGIATPAVYEVDTETGELLNIAGVLNVGGGFTDIAVDSSGRILGLYDPTGGSLRELFPDPRGADDHFVGPTNAALDGLAFGEGGRLFATGAGNGIWEVDALTGAATVLHAPIAPGFEGLGGDLVHAGGATFYATSLLPCGGSGACLWNINVDTGDGFAIGPTGIDFVSGLAISDGLLFGITRDGDLYEIDPGTGASTFNTSIERFGSVYGAASAPVLSSPPPPPVVPIPATLPLLLGALSVVCIRRRKRSAQSTV